MSHPATKEGTGGNISEFQRECKWSAFAAAVEGYTETESGPSGDRNGLK